MGTIIKSLTSPGDDWAECNGMTIDTNATELNLPKIPASATKISDYISYSNSLYLCYYGNNIYFKNADNSAATQIYKLTNGTHSVISSEIFANSFCILKGFLITTYGDTINVYKLSTLALVSSYSSVMANYTKTIVSVANETIVVIGYNSNYKNNLINVYAIDSAGALSIKKELTVSNSIVSVYELPIVRGTNIYLCSNINNSSSNSYNCMYISISSDYNTYVAIIPITGSYIKLTSNYIYSEAEYFDIHEGVKKEKMFYDTTNLPFDYCDLNGIYFYTDTNKASYIIDGKLFSINPLGISVYYGIYDRGNDNIFAFGSDHYLYKFTNFTKKVLPYKPGHFIKIK